MRSNHRQTRQFKEVSMAHDIAVHALREYREWRDNAYIGRNLGSARESYVAILRRRVRASLEAYRLVRSATRAAAHYTEFRKAA